MRLFLLTVFGAAASIERPKAAEKTGNAGESELGDEGVERWPGHRGRRSSLNR
jgi:hypothetical protein